MSQEYIKIRGARVHNLKDVNVELPLNKLTVFSGPSGSGKSSLAFHTIFSESKRRFLNSFPTYLKFFSDRPAPVDVDSIKPVLPVFGLPQVNPVVGSRSTVGDIMQLTELLASHFYHFSKQLCPIHKVPFLEKKISGFIDEMSIEESETYHILIDSQYFKEYFSKRPFPSRSIKSKKARTIQDFDAEDDLWEVQRFKRKHLKTLDKKLEEVISLGCPIYLFSENSKKVSLIDYKKGELICPESNCKEKGTGSVDMHHFSPYNPVGACSECNGFGETLEYDEDKLFNLDQSVKEGGVLLLNYKRFQGQKSYLQAVLKKKKISLDKPLKELPKSFWDILYHGKDHYIGFYELFSYLESKKYKMNVRIFIRNIQKNVLCKKCLGTRLSSITNNFYLTGKTSGSLSSLLRLSLGELKTNLEEIKETMFSKERHSLKSLNKILSILGVACELGLSHLSCLRKSKSLSAGEYQRLLLLKYLSYEGTGSLFIFDEPSLGLENKELKSLVKALRSLIKLGNTIVIVDHNKFLKEQSDHIIQMGPGAGKKGGQVEYSGPYKKEDKKNNNLKLKANSHKSVGKIKIVGAKIYDKKFKLQELPIGQISLIKGPSGSGKTSLYVKTLANELYFRTYGEHLKTSKGEFKKINSDKDFKEVVIVDANLNRYTSRSTVGSLTGLFPVVRKYFVSKPQAKAMGLSDGHLSYNSNLGQCPKCEGKGHIIIEMQFLEDIVLECEDCKGKKLKPHYANITDKEISVHEAFTGPLHIILDKISLTPKFKRVYQYLKLLNLDYLSLDRQINSLSGGERQRIYLLSKLLKDLSDSFIVFENISFGLSEKELIDLAKFLLDLNKKENTLVIIDQHPIFKEICNNINTLGG